MCVNGDKVLQGSFVDHFRAKKFQFQEQTFSPFRGKKRLPSLKPSWFTYRVKNPLSSTPISVSLAPPQSSLFLSTFSMEQEHCCSNGTLNGNTNHLDLRNPSCSGYISLILANKVVRIRYCRKCIATIQYVFYRIPPCTKSNVVTSYPKVVQMSVLNHTVKVNRDTCMFRLAHPIFINPSYFYLIVRPKSVNLLKHPFCMVKIKN